MTEAKTKTKTEPLDPWQGPFPEYMVVTTPVGEFGIKAFHILDFNSKQVVNKKTFEIEDQFMPFYRLATQEELDAAGIGDAKNYMLAHDHPDKIHSKIDPDQSLKDRIGRNTATVNKVHPASVAGHQE